MTTIKILCSDPQCQQEHALCWMVGKRTRRLGIFCDRHPIVSHSKGDTVCREHTAFRPIDPSRLEGQDLSGIPEFYTPEARKQAALQGQDQFILMNTKPGEVVERSVPLSVGDEPEIARLEKEMEQELEAARKLRTQSNQTLKESRERRDKARKISVKLGELKTFKLI